jgi:hypothetical protein
MMISPEEDTEDARIIHKVLRMATGGHFGFTIRDFRFLPSGLTCAI